MNPWMRSRLRTTDIRLGPGRGVVSLYSEIMPHMIMRAKSLKRGKDGVLHRAADILEINIDARRARLVERGAEIGAAMVERGIEAELVLDIAALVGAAGDPDDPRT